MISRHGLQLLFQHTAARRRLRYYWADGRTLDVVSTHSRPKAAANVDKSKVLTIDVSTHSRPKAAAFKFKSSYY